MNLGREEMAGGGERGGLKDLDIIAGVGDFKSPGIPADRGQCHPAAPRYGVGAVFTLEKQG